jgi:hypothetical protein
MKDYSAPETSPGRRAAANWFIDGLPEIVAGLEFAILGGMTIWLLHQPLRFEKLLSVGVLLLLILLVNGGDRMITVFLKARVTYPRTGYVLPPMHTEESQLLEPIVSLAHPPTENVTDFRRRTVAVLFAGWVLPVVIGRSWGVPVTMSAVALALYALNRRSERPYRWWYTLFLPAAGLLWMALDPRQVEADLTEQFGVFVIAGLWLSGQGAWTLFEYLRRNPRPASREGLHA